MSRETMSTIGEQRRFNYALKPMSKDEFIRMMTTDLPEAPAYFAKDAELNRTGAAPLDRLPEGRPLTPGEARDFQGEGHMILDVRPSSAFGNAHVPGSVNIGLGGQFASWAGSLIPMGTRVVIVAEDEVGVGEATLRLARVGLDSVDGYLAGGIYAWDRAGFELARIPQMPVDELEARIEEGVRLRILDVRRPSEYQSGHVPGAGNLPLADLERQAAALPGPRDAATVVICLSGYRSSAATSLLARMGFSDLYNVVGGTTAWVSAKYPVETPAG
jgi:rhodanese-related sulfurtransferase